VRDNTIWSKHGEVGENVPQETFDDVIMSNIAPRRPPQLFLMRKRVSTRKIMDTITNDDTFTNTFTDDTEHDDGIS
jgi:hypothetical protein